MGDLLTLEGLTFGYGSQAVLKAIHFGVRRGDLFIVIGPNGSGKTTLLNLIAGTLPVPGGTVLLDGRPIQHFTPRERARRLAYVPQHHHLAFPFRVFDLVLLGRAPHLGLLGRAGKRDRRRTDEALALMDLAAKADQPVDALSGGERQRAQIARAVCQDTPLMLLDEPTASLDLGHQVRLMDLLQRLCRRSHRTIVMVCHDLNLAARYADRIVLLNAGRIAAQGEPAEVLEQGILESIYNCRLRVETPTAGRPWIQLA